MDGFRSVPDGEYTKTIYSLIRDQKYHEVFSLLLIPGYQHPEH